MLVKGGKFYTRVWGTNCEGAQSGEMIEPGTSKNPTAGPCKDMGVSHFFSKDELAEMFSDWSSVDMFRLTTENMQSPENLIEEWVVWATK